MLYSTVDFKKEGFEHSKATLMSVEMLFLRMLMMIIMGFILTMGFLLVYFRRNPDLEFKHEPAFFTVALLTAIHGISIVGVSCFHTCLEISDYFVERLIESYEKNYKSIFQAT
ncbi:uncharacterized protein LOC111623865 isoform X1 [Centruroides sculpturatus]|uniref:uncharacterized protein LOC111623865 isoform X1 n=1 Tax=Centruroides sculpturatus TaxID=218467 RepID=UPI000C6CBA5D|nr:uncharacterized protein LOC111623865 isoform X1 [Centruroides sculpturatus]